MTRDTHDRCQDVLAAIDAIGRYSPKLSGPDGDMAYDAIVRQLVIIGEAVTRLDDVAKAHATEIEWTKIGGFRNLAIHEYFRMDSTIVTGIVSNYLPPLAIAISRIGELEE